MLLLWKAQQEISSAEIFQVTKVNKKYSSDKVLLSYSFNHKVVVAKRQTNVVIMFPPTEFQFSIGRKRITWPSSKLYNCPGRTKLANTFGRQQLEPCTCTWLERASRNPYMNGKMSKLCFLLFCSKSGLNSWNTKRTLNAYSSHLIQPHPKLSADHELRSAWVVVVALVLRDCDTRFE